VTRSSIEQRRHLCNPSTAWALLHLQARVPGIRTGPGFSSGGVQDQIHTPYCWTVGRSLPSRLSWRQERESEGSRSAGPAIRRLSNPAFRQDNFLNQRRCGNTQIVTGQIQTIQAIIADVLDGISLKPCAWSKRIGDR